ncbi:MAG: tRNA dihydrouridine synthase DusB [Clostridia bacterium]|nr:tRNA dihydrouridine synthase DusB [Clostridia bacterium]
MSENFFGKVMLAPMAGEGDYTFRASCKRFGADYLVSEMISAKAICYNDKKTPLLAKIREEEMPIALQIFGCEPEYMARAADFLINESIKAGTPCAAIDINMGCPVNKVVKNGEGSALMKTPDLAGKIVYAVKNVTGNLPVTVKMRLGWDNSSKNVVELSKIAEENGASAICVHARTREQLYSPGVDISYIAKVKKAVSVPVIGNGDIFNAEDALNMFRETGCDAVAIARGALGNPYIFEEVKAALEGKEYTPPTPRERIEEAIREIEMRIADKGEYTGLRESRVHTAHFTKSLRGSATIRGKLNLIDSFEEVRELLLNYAYSLESENE